MTLRVKTVEYAFDPCVTAITTTTIASAQRYETPELTISLPEATSRTFRSVKIQASWRNITSVNYGNWLFGVKLGAVAFEDTIRVFSNPAHTSDHECSLITSDCTSYFETNFGSGTSQTCQIAFAMGDEASSINNITIKILITYEYDDDSLTEEVKTVRIPIQSHHALLTASHQEFGTTGGTNNAPANQIPQLTGVGGFLPEDSISIKRAWIEWWGNDAGASTADLTFYYQIDSDTEVAHVILEQGLNTGTFFYTHSIYDTTTYSTASAHALKARSSLTNRFSCLGAVLHVTYSYNPTTTTTVCNSVQFAIGGDEVPPGFINGTTSADADSISINLWVEEPETITLQQSGILMFITGAAGGSFRVLSEEQAERTYTLTALVNAGGYAVVHRIDHNNGFTLTRGKNENILSLYNTSNTNNLTLNAGFAYINYHSGIAATGINSHNKTTFWSLNDFSTAGTSVAVQREIDTTDQRTPNIPETNYFINRAAFELYVRQSAATFVVSLLAEKQLGEHNGSGWYPIGINTYTNDGEMCNIRFTLPALSGFNRTPFESGEMDIETARKYRIHHLANAANWLSGIWITYHSITFSVSGIVSGSSGGDVTITAYDTVDKKALGSTSRTGNGVYTITVYDNSRTMYTEAREDDTLIGRSPNGTAT